MVIFSTKYSKHLHCTYVVRKSMQRGDGKYFWKKTSVKLLIDVHVWFWNAWGMRRKCCSDKFRRHCEFDWLIMLKKYLVMLRERSGNHFGRPLGIWNSLRFPTCAVLQMTKPLNLSILQLHCNWIVLKWGTYLHQDWNCIATMLSTYIVCKYYTPTAIFLYIVGRWGHWHPEQDVCVFCSHFCSLNWYMSFSDAD